MPLFETHLCLVSTQATPNLLPALDEAWHRVKLVQDCHNGLGHLHPGNSVNTMNSKPPPLDLTALRNALASLQKAVVRWQGSGEQDEELRDACIQRFEYTFELSWKMLKRRLEIELPDSQSVDTLSFREMVRSGAERGWIADADAWMVFRDKRNLTSHTYNAGIAADVAVIIPKFAQHASTLLSQLEARARTDA